MGDEVQKGYRDRIHGVNTVEDVEKLVYGTLCDSNVMSNQLLLDVVNYIVELKDRNTSAFDKMSDSGKKNAMTFICCTRLQAENEYEDFSKSTKKLNEGLTPLLIAYLCDKKNSSKHKARLVNTLFLPYKDNVHTTYFDEYTFPQHKKRIINTITNLLDSDITFKSCLNIKTKNAIQHAKNLEDQKENMEIMEEQQVRGNANQENNANQQNHINQQNQGENGQVPVVNEQVEVQAEPQVQERRRPRGGLERTGGANGLQGNQVGGRNGNNRGNVL